MTGEVKERRHKGGLECLSDACDCFGGKSERVLGVEAGERPPWVETGETGTSSAKPWTPTWMPKGEEWPPSTKERRERIATAVLAAYVTHNSVEPMLNTEGAARASCLLADALIAELDKEWK